MCHILDSTCECYQIILAFLWFSMTVSQSIHVAINGITSFYCIAKVIFHCIYVPHLLYLFICQWTFSFFPMSWLLYHHSFYDNNFKNVHVCLLIHETFINILLKKITFVVIKLATWKLPWIFFLLILLTKSVTKSDHFYQYEISMSVPSPLFSQS